MRLAADSATLKERKIGVIGLGMVGNALVKNLKREGYSVTSVLDSDASKYAEFTSFSTPASSPMELAQAVDVVFTALPMPHNVKAVFEGESGLLAGLQGKDWVDHSTTDYEQTEEMNKLVVAAGGRMLEAPVTGGLEALRKGQMTVFLAGEKLLAEEYMPLMESIYCNVIYTGQMGTALIPKVLSNMLTCVHNQAMGEVFMIGKRAGVDMRTMFDCIRASSGNSFVWETGGPMLMQGTYDPSFSLALQCKDNRLGYQIATKHKVPLQILGHAMNMYNTALYTYGDDAPCYINPKMLEDHLGVDLRSDGFENWSYSIQNIDGSSVIRHHGLALKRTKVEESVDDL
jgi:3-hydroxyisobutyrate dehydrogenase